MKRLLIVAAFVATAAGASGCNSCRPRLFNWSWPWESESCATACGCEMGGMSGGCVTGCNSGMVYDSGGVLLPAPSPTGTTRVLPGPAEALPPGR